MNTLKQVLPVSENMKDRKKIIHLIQALDNGGCENMLLRTLPLLLDFKHMIITLKKRGELAEQMEQKGIKIINIGQNNFLSIFSYLRLLKEIRKENPNIIITYLFHADAIGRIFLQVFTKIKIVPFLRTTYNHKEYWPARLFEKITKYFVKDYLANSESVKNFYVEKIGVAKEKITVIPNGIDVAFYDKIKKDENLRENLGIRKEELAIICVANLHINKGHKYLLKAFEDVYKENWNIKLLLVGDGKEKENLLRQIENYSSKNNILFLGKRNDVPQLLKISDIFVLPTLFEGMSNAIMEAMASGLAILASDIPENRKLLNLDNRFLFRVNDANDLASKILFLLSNSELRLDLGKKSRETIQKKFELKIVIQNFIKILNSLF